MTAAQEGPPGRGSGPDDQELVVVIPPDWRETYPFSARFLDTEGAAHVIDLAAARFATDGLVDAGRGKNFREPDLSTFPASNVREAFAAGAPLVARELRGREVVARELFIVQATDAKAQVALRGFLERARIPILGYIPRDAYLVRLDPRSHSLLSAQEGVFWIGLFQPAYRVAPDLDFILQADPAHQLKLRLRLDPETYASEADVRAAIGGVPDAAVVDVVRGRRDWIVRVDGPVTLARTLSALPGVMWVERFVNVRLLNNVARTSSSVPTGRGAVAGPIMDVEDVWARGIRGEGQIAAAADTGLSTGDNVTTGSLHYDFGEAGSPTNPMRVIKGYALNDRGTWNDDQSIEGGHGTHTSGSIVGNGILSGSTPSTNTFPAGSFAGTAPKAGFVFQSVMYTPGPCSPNPPPCLMLPGDLNNLFLAPYNDGARVHSNSWGSPVNGAYDTGSQTLDEFVWDHKDMVVTFAAGNSGTDGTGTDGVINADSMGSPGTAKNCITVGASENYRPDFIYEYPANTCTPGGYTWGWFSGADYPAAPISADLMADNANGMAAFSSRGPTDDNRFKPDITAPGVGIISTRTWVNQGYEQWGICNVPVAQRPSYVSMGGTSMANPLTAGAATLVRQYYVDGWHANDTDVTNAAPVPAQGFNPSAALVKATLINGAWDMAPGQYGSTAPQPELPSAPDRVYSRTLPNNAEGYGRVDLEAALFPASGWGRDTSRNMLVRDVSPGLVATGRDSRTYGVGSSTDPLIVTLVWTDPFATAGAGAKIVNNLDLEVTSPTGKRYNTNKVDVSVQSPTAFVRDSTNTVEQVKVTVPETGNWTIDVVGTAVPGNGVLGTTTQPYALVVSGVSCAVPAIPTGIVATPSGNNRIDVSWASVAGATEYHVYRGLSAGQSTTYVGMATATPFVDSTVQGGVRYYYVVKAATGAACESARSAEVNALATGACTIGPTFNGLNTVTNPATATCGLTLAWTVATARCGGPLTYSVYRSTTSGFAPGPANRLASGLSAVTTYTDTSALVSGTTYYYIVRATDDGSDVEETNTVERSGVPTGGTGSQTLYGLQNFDALTDGSYAGWLVGTFTGVATDWRGVQTCTGHSGAKVFRFGGATCTAPYADATPGQQNHSIALLPAIAVPAGASGASLSFWHKWDFEPSWDGAYLSISLNGTNFYYVPGSAITANGYNTVNNYLGVSLWDGTHTAAYVNTVVNLDTACNAVAGNTGGCAGKTVYIGFATFTDDIGNFLGWFIDDVQVTATAPVACSAAPSPLPFLSARATPGQNLLEWRNPTSGAYGSAMVRFLTGAAYPTLVTQGTQVTCPAQNPSPGAYNSCTHTGLTNGTVYSYSVWVDNGAGVYSSRKSVQATPFATGGGRQWSYSTGAANLAPAGVLPGPVGGGAIFALSNDRALHAMDPTTAGGNWPRTGSFDWTPAAMNAPAQHRPPVVPLLAGPRVFLASQDGYAYAVDARTGALLWTSARLGEVLQANPAGLFTEFRATAPNRIFVATRNATSANALFALDPDTGATLGQFDNGGGANAIGIINGITVDYATNLVYFTSRAPAVGSPDTLWCVDAVTMTGVWSLAVGDIDGSPTLFGGKIYVGTNAGQLKAIDASTHAVVWTYTCSPLDGPIKGYIVPHVGSSPLRLSFSTNTRVWGIVDGASTASFSVLVSSPSTPLYVPGTNYLLVGRSNGWLYQLNATTGATVTTVTTLGGTLGAPTRDSVNSVYYIGSTTGVLHALTLPVP